MSHVLRLLFLLGCLRCGSLGGFRHGICVLGHGGTEHGSKGVDLVGEGLLVGPGQVRVQHFSGNTFQRLGDRQVEDGEVFEFGFGQGTVVDGVDDGSGVLERASLSGTELSSGPTSVDQPTIDLVLGHPLFQHLGVMGRVESQEGGTVTGREDRRGLRDTILGTGGLGGVTSQEVVVGLFRSQLGDGRQDTEGVAAQHDDVARLSLSDTRDLGIGDVFDGVGTSGVFRNRDIVVVGNTVGRVVNNVLQNGSVSDGVEDLRLLLGR